MGPAFAQDGPAGGALDSRRRNPSMVHMPSLRLMRVPSAKVYSAA